MSDKTGMMLNFANLTDVEAHDLGIADDATMSPFKIGDNVVAFGRHVDLGNYLLVRNGLSRFFVISEAAYNRVAFE